MSSQKILSGNFEAWCYQTLGGINYDRNRPGFKHIILRPRPVGDLTWARASHVSVYGKIVSDWKLSDGRIHWRVVVPPNTTATAYIPTTSADLIREDHRRRWHNRIQKRASFLKPSLFLGRMLSGRHRTPDWVHNDDRLVVVEHMTGFRMSFRSAVIKKVMFDDKLKGYALSEDIDASLAAARSGILVGAHDAKIYHHRFPNGRENGFSLGATAFSIGR